MEYTKTELQKKIEDQEGSSKYLSWVFWLVIFSMFGFIASIVIISTYVNKKEFKSFFPITSLCFAMSYIFASIMLLMSLNYLQSYNKPEVVKKIRLLGFIPLVNICLVYYIMSLKHSFRKEVKAIVKNKGQPVKEEPNNVE
ncbi:MAG: hypothetical protein Ta2E_03850 [Mycoplasmoidaceae bacterium]|nr:MAG: hypothetical protein Ta2E_03850 [Mycoplasmoidaceae bacterium]